MNLAKLAIIQDIDQRKRIMRLLQEYERSGGSMILVDRMIERITSKNAGYTDYRVENKRMKQHEITPSEN